ncbi:hypothetical protein E1091_08665 [Micromonospora fluostatini]|uniref:Uncharacterized protein n=1 Tax=Micromonospora fluostatini TaxID=1629071 RepID=A0ABY2DMI4_9ACTN|nr:hypothetical protein E1091_08665 [Micromonospora fluostatini]
MNGDLAVLKPVVDGVGGDAEFGGGLHDADLAVLDGAGAGPSDVQEARTRATPTAVQWWPRPVAGRRP